MYLSNLQGRQWPLKSTGNVKDVVNTRPDVFNAFHSLPKPQQLMPTSRRILGLDRRGDNDNVLSLDVSTGTLCLEGCFDADDVFTSLAEPIASDAGDIREIAACGAYLCCRRSDGSLFFLHHNTDSNEYEPLGELPGELSYSLEKVDEVPVTFVVQACSWKSSDDLRDGIPADVVAAASDAVKDAWAQAMLTCEQMDSFVQPVTLRLAVRLFDDSLYYLTDPIRVEDAEWQGTDRFSLPIATDSSGKVTGTQAAMFTVTPYRVTLTLENPDEPLWNEIFSKIEVYVEPEQDVVNSVTDCSVSYSQLNRTLNLFLPLHPTREMEQKLGQGPYRLRTSAEAGSITEYYIGPHGSEELHDLRTVKPVAGQGDVIMSHGAFLHFTSGSILNTSQRSNPFALCTSTGFGSRIMAMAALPSGGGAYTRQYLYVFTESCIFALMHDSQGRHTNCRPVASYVVSDARRVVSTDNAVYALSDNGCLLCLKDANPEVLFRGLPPFKALQWDGIANELYLENASEGYLADSSQASTLVLQLNMPRLAFRRTMAVDETVRQSGRILYTRQGQLWQARSYTAYGAAPELAEEGCVRWELPSPQKGTGRMLKLHGSLIAPAQLSVNIKGENELLVQTAATTAQLDTNLRTPLLETEAQWQQGAVRRFIIPLVAPPEKYYPTVYHLMMTGRWSTLMTPLLEGGSR